MAAARSADPRTEASAASKMTRATGPCSHTTSARNSITAQRDRSPASSTARRLKRSATTPPTGPSTAYGTSRRMVAAPTQAAEPVASYT